MFSTLVIGGAGSLMLDLYGWESVFYASGLLSVLWSYCMWKYLLKGEGKGGFYHFGQKLSINVSPVGLDCCSSIIAGLPENTILSYANLSLCFQGPSSPSSRWGAAGPSPS